MATAARAAEKPARPNILWLISEDQGPELGCYGYKGVETPHIDALARDGVLFKNAFTTAPVCSSSRSAFSTGMYQIGIGAHNHRTTPEAMRELPPGVRLVSHWLKDAGYFTVNIRKLPPALGIRQVNFWETHRDFTGEKRTDPAKVVIPPYYPDHPVARRDWADYLDATMELDRKSRRSRRRSCCPQPRLSRAAPAPARSHV